MHLLCETISILCSPAAPPWGSPKPLTWLAVLGDRLLFLVSPAQAHPSRLKPLYWETDAPTVRSPKSQPLFCWLLQLFLVLAGQLKDPASVQPWKERSASFPVDRFTDHDLR